MLGGLLGCFNMALIPALAVILLVSTVKFAWGTNAADKRREPSRLTAGDVPAGVVGQHDGRGDPFAHGFPVDREALTDRHADLQTVLTDPGGVGCEDRRGIGLLSHTITSTAPSPLTSRVRRQGPSACLRALVTSSLTPS